MCKVKFGANLNHLLSYFEESNLNFSFFFISFAALLFAIDSLPSLSIQIQNKKFAVIEKFPSIGSLTSLENLITGVVLPFDFLLIVKIYLHTFNMLLQKSYYLSTTQLNKKIFFSFCQRYFSNYTMYSACQIQNWHWFC